MTFGNGRVACIGFAPAQNKWYGWSHRAMYGFGIGDEVHEGDLTNMSGFTDEYLDMMILIDDDAQSMAEKIDESMKLPCDEMNEMAECAYRFVTEEKNWEKQGKKIHDFLMKDINI